MVQENNVGCGRQYVQRQQRSKVTTANDDNPTKIHEGGVVAMWKESNWTTHRRSTAQIFQPSTSTYTGNTNSTLNDNNTIVWSPLRISGIITLCLTLLTYIGLHFLAAQQRKRRPPRQTVVTPQTQAGNHNCSNIGAGEDSSPRCNENQIEQAQSSMSQPRVYTTVDVDMDNISVPHECRLSKTTTISEPVGDSNSRTDTNYRRDDTNTSGDYSHLSITPAYTATATSTSLSNMVHSDGDNNNRNSIPNMIIAKHRKGEKKNLNKHQQQNVSDDLVVSDTNERTRDAIATTVLLGPHDEQNIDYRNLCMTNNTVQAQPPNATFTTSTTASLVDDDEVLFYEQTLHFSHHGQRENIRLPIPIAAINHIDSDTANNDHDDNHMNHMDDHLVMTSSLWVSNEDSFLFPTNTDV